MSDSELGWGASHAFPWTGVHHCHLLSMSPGWKQRTWEVMLSEFLLLSVAEIYSLQEIHVSVSFSTKPWPGPQWDKFAFIWQVLSGVWNTGKASQLEVEVEITPDCPWVVIYVDATFCGETEAGNSSLHHIQSLVSCLTLSLSFVSRFLTAQDCALLISLRSCACALPLSPAPLLYPQNPPKAPPWSPGQRLQSYWTNLFLGFYYRFFRAETILETPGLVLCLVKNNGVGKRLEEQPNPGRKPSMPAHPLPHCPSWCWAVCAVGLDGVCWPFRQVHCEGCYRLASAGGGRTEREGGRWKVHIYHIWDFAWFVLNQSTANYLPSPS